MANRYRTTDGDRFLAAARKHLKKSRRGVMGSEGVGEGPGWDAPHNHDQVRWGDDRNEKYVPKLPIVKSSECRGYGGLCQQRLARRQSGNR